MNINFPPADTFFSAVPCQFMKKYKRIMARQEKELKLKTSRLKIRRLVFFVVKPMPPAGGTNQR